MAKKNVDAPEKKGKNSKNVVEPEKVPKEDKSEIEESEEKEAKEEKEKKESSIFVKVTDDTRSIIDKYKETGKTISSIIDSAIKMYDNYHSMPPEIQATIEKHEEQYGSKIKEIEEAVKLLDKEDDPKKVEDQDLWRRARDEMKMMLIGKTTFNQLIAAAEAPKESLEKPFKRNVAFDLILWYTGKPIKNLSLEELLKTVQKMWVVANYFYMIDINKVEEDQYHLLLKHRQNKRYSNYWLGYFTKLFSSEELSFKCIVEGQAFDETLSLTVKKAFDKENEEL